MIYNNNDFEMSPDELGFYPIEMQMSCGELVAPGSKVDGNHLALIRLKGHERLWGMDDPNKPVINAEHVIYMDEDSLDVFIHTLLEYAIRHKLMNAAGDHQLKESMGGDLNAPPSSN